MYAKMVSGTAEGASYADIYNAVTLAERNIWDVRIWDGSAKAPRRI